ncbi:DUF6173 family protein [uncultured Megasphaera sp.]|uniref:DUF6173 family protein n=1 Tax=Megasphaera massiliensis TaxID=1232428 RepID=UPI00266CCB11|nr:DUF6173 family protein [uncultured Megasphaera sp.]
MKTEKKTIPVQEEVYPDEVKEMALCPPAPETETEDPEAPYMASDMYQRIVALINNFESELPDTMQAGGRLVSAGDITFSIQDIGYWDPNMIVFYGELSDGSAVELVQHLSQLNLLLVAVPRQDDIQKPRRVIGFTQKAEPDIIHDAQD